MADSAHIHFFLGNDDYAIRQRVAQFESAFSDPTTADMNTSRLDARTTSEAELVNAVSAMPFLAAQRLVVLENPSKKYQGAEGHKKFIAFLDGIPASTRLVLLEFEPLKEREIQNHWLVKWVGKSEGRGMTQTFMMPRQREMPGWIVQETRRQGGQIEPAAAARLAEMVGENTRQASQEIIKLLTYVNFSHAVGIEDVEAVSVVTAGVDVFDLVDALGMRDGRKAQKLFHRLMEEKDAFEIFGMVVRQFRMLLIAREVMDASGTLQEVTEALGAHPYVAEKVFGQARRFDSPTLESIYRRLLAMDEAAKTGVMTLELSMEMLIVEMTK